MAHEVRDDAATKAELDVENGRPVPAEECDHEHTLEATEHDDAPTGAEICRDCGTRVDD